MKISTLLVTIILFSCNSFTSKEDNSEITTYYFIRHAEKATDDPSNRDPDLTEAGIKRSQNWAKVFEDISFDLIYSSDFKRTRATAQIIADSQSKKVSFYNASKLNDEDFQEKTTGKTVLVVGHSNTNPEFINYILQEEKYSNIDESEYGSLYIITVMPDGSKTSTVLYINE